MGLNSPAMFEVTYPPSVLFAIAENQRVTIFLMYLKCTLMLLGGVKQAQLKLKSLIQLENNKR